MSRSESEVEWDTLVVLNLDEFTLIVGDVDEVEVERDLLSDLELHWLTSLLWLVELELVIVRVFRELNVGVVWDSGVGDVSLVVLPVDMLLSPGLPLLLASHWPGWVGIEVKKG